MMEVMEELLQWAEEQGVKLSGIRAIPLTGRGIGIVSTRKIKKGECIVDVPTTCLKSLDTTKHISRKLPKGTSTHCILTLDLCLDKSPSFAKWTAVMPSREDMVGMPILWPAKLQERLPVPARKLLEKQKTKVERDWAVVSSSTFAKDVTYDDFLHAWILVNSRTFYHVTERTERLPPDDRMVLQPVADLFNHTATGGCKVSFDERGFSVDASQDVAKGEEVLISYGRHSNDFLLVEYGFFLQDNEWDEVSLDDAVLRRLRPKQKEVLREKGYLEGYFVDQRAVCYRTEVAARLLCCSTREWLSFVDEGVDDDDVERKVEREVQGFLREALDGAEGALSDLRTVRTGDKRQREVLKARWVQIGDFLGTMLQDIDE